MRSGLSGALVVDDYEYGFGIHFSSDYNVDSRNSQAFYSSGYPLQKLFYFDVLVGWYGSYANFKTRLFLNWLT